MYRADPDIIVGHEFLGVSLDILLHQMKELKADYGRELRFHCLNQGSSSGLYVSSDGLVDKASSVPVSDNVIFSPKKKVKTNRPLGITPTIDKIGLQGETEYDSVFDNLFDGIDMDGFMDIALGKGRRVPELCCRGPGVLAFCSHGFSHFCSRFCLRASMWDAFWRQKTTWDAF